MKSVLKLKENRFLFESSDRKQNANNNNLTLAIWQKNRCIILFNYANEIFSATEDEIAII